MLYVDDKAKVRLQMHNVFLNSIFINLIFVFVSFVALSPKSIAMVMAGRSVHLTTLFPGQA